MTGTIVNVCAVVAGGTVGLLAHSRLSERFTTIFFQGIGLVTLAIGVSMSLRSDDLILAIISIVAGAVIGEGLRLEQRLEKGADRLKTALRIGNGRFTEGMVTATMLYCVGSMSILGSIEDGMGFEPKLLLAKSLMDGIAAIALASAMGAGVIFSIIPMFIYQGGITLLAVWLSRIMSEGTVDGMTCVGGILLLGLAINILGIKKISVVNMLPSLVVAVILYHFFA